MVIKPNSLKIPVLYLPLFYFENFRFKLTLNLSPNFPPVLNLPILQASKFIPG